VRPCSVAVTALVVGAVELAGCNARVESAPRHAADDLIVFSSNRAGSFRLYACHSDGSKSEALTSGDRDDVGPVWSPSGDRIAFVSGDTLCLLDWTSRKRQSLDVTVDPDFSLAWSPAGDRILCGSGDQLLSVNLNTKATTRIADGCLAGTWMPDKTSLLVTRGQIPMLQVLGTDGRSSLFLKGAGHLLPQLQGVWSTAVPPRCAFSSTDMSSLERGSRSALKYDVFVSSADGSEPTQVFSTPGVDSAWGWSPDGRALLVSSDQEGKADLFIVWVGTDRRLNLTSDAALERGASWRP